MTEAHLETFRLCGAAQKGLCPMAIVHEQEQELA